MPTANPYPDTTHCIADGEKYPYLERNPESVSPDDILNATDKIGQIYLSGGNYVFLVDDPVHISALAWR